MSDIIQHNEDSNVERIVRPDALENAFTIKQYQDIYHQITGKTESITRSYSDSLLLGFDDLVQLHHKVMQLREVHHVVACNESITVFHDGDRKERYTSFDRFKLYNLTSTSPTTSLVLKYNFSILTVGGTGPQEYVLTIRLASRVALSEQMSSNAPSFLRGRLMALIADNTAEIKVEFADYVVARSFMEAFDEWIKGCNKTPKTEFFNWLKMRSHWMRSIFPFVMIMLLVVFAWKAIPEYFSGEVLAAASARFVVIYSAAAYFLIVLGAAVGRMAESAIDSYPILSYINLNKGDAALIRKFDRVGPIQILRLVGSTVMAVVLGVVACKIDRILGW